MEGEEGGTEVGKVGGKEREVNKYQDNSSRVTFLLLGALCEECTLCMCVYTSLSKFKLQSLSNRTVDPI